MKVFFYFFCDVAMKQEAWVDKQGVRYLYVWLFRALQAEYKIFFENLFEIYQVGR